MTACTMPSDYGTELLLGSSPVVGSGFHGTGSSFFSDYPRCGSPNVMWDTTTTSSAYNYSQNLVGHHYSADITPTDQFKSFAKTGSLRRSKKLEKLKHKLVNQPLLFTNPAKSCLRQDLYTQYEDPVTSPTREKKKVSFADALGQQLAQIKLITERPDCPPLWSNDFIEKVTGGIPPDSPVKRWEVTFTQPASDYVNFKNRLDTENISLENVIIEENGEQGVIKGTIKVRNLSFHKDVLVRYTTNGWRSTQDVTASYIPSPSTFVAYDIYDRFGFDIPLPDVALTDKLEFCVRYSCDGAEYWDNNNGRNYVIISFRSKTKRDSRSQSTDPYHMSLDSFTEFASWNQSSLSDSPYW